jgi:hypothetical protein
MAKRVKIPVRALGSNAGIPEVPALAEWVAGRTGKPGDLITYQLEVAFLPQIGSAVDLACAGGPFYEERWRAAIGGLEDRAAIGEMSARTEAITDDALDIAGLRKGSWFAVPAPHALGLTDRYFNDKDEFRSALHDVYRTLMREMRDCAAGGHVLLADSLEEDDLSALARKKAFFFIRDPNPRDLALLLEYQQDIAVPVSRVADVLGLAEEYEIGKIILIDPDEGVFRDVLAQRDPDTIEVGGFCETACDRYWRDLVAASSRTLT